MDSKSPFLMPNSILQRKGARKGTDIPKDVLLLLQQCQLETVNLTEWLAIDHVVLLHYALTEFDLQRSSDVFLSELDLQAFQERTRLFDAMATHRSDSIRCWAAYIVGIDSHLSVEDKLAGIRPFAADSHFGVREIAWMAVRESISLELL